jgi:cytochrome c553
LLACTVAVKTVAADENSQVIAQLVSSGDPILGKTISASERCQECHGEDGNSTDSRIPKHAGQSANYLIKQLRDFQSGARQHEVMSVMAEDLTASNIADIAAYFASQTTMQGVPAKDYPLASQLFFQGDGRRAIEPCQSCHGTNGKGKLVGNVSYPVIGGQNKNYLRAQLVSWKLGERSNSPDGVMNKVAKLLTDDEIEALANYLSGL